MQDEEGENMGGIRMDVLRSLVSTIKLEWKGGGNL